MGNSGNCVGSLTQNLQQSRDVAEGAGAAWWQLIGRYLPVSVFTMYVPVSTPHACDARWRKQIIRHVTYQSSLIIRMPCSASGRSRHVSKDTSTGPEGHAWGLHDSLL